MCVTVINVGYGDAILFQLKNGYTALLDGGSALESEFEGDSYRIRSADYLARQQIEHLLFGSAGRGFRSFWLSGPLE